MSYQLKCPDLVKTVPEICSLDVKLQGKSEKFLCFLKIVDGFIVSEMQKNYEVCSFNPSLVTVSPNHGVEITLFVVNNDLRVHF